MVKIADTYTTNLSLTKPELAVTGWGNKINNNLEDIDLSLGSNNFAYDEDSTTGLNFYYKNGRVLFGTTCSKTSASYVTLTDNDDNYIESTTGGSISANVVGFTTGRIPLFVVTTSSGEITDVVDHRALLGTYLPYVYNQDLETTDNVEFQSMALGGTLTMDNNNDDKITLEATSLAVDEDNWIRFKADANELFRFGTNGNTTVNTTTLDILDASGTTLFSLSQAGKLTISDLTASNLIYTDGSKVFTSAFTTDGNYIYLGSSGKIGRDADNLIDFSTDNQITFRTNATDYTISPTIFSYLDDLDQALNTTASPTFASDTYIRKDQNSETRLRIRNDTNGTGSSAMLWVMNTTSQYGILCIRSPSYSGVGGLNYADSVGFISYGCSNGINFFTEDSAPFRIGTNNTVRLTVDTNGYAQWSSRWACNGATPQAPVALVADATDLASVITLANALKTMAVANGQMASS